MTDEEYQKIIPDCCQYQTAERHKDELGYCWGISYGFITAGTYCEDCEFCIKPEAK